MASFTLATAPWPVGTSVLVYYAEGWPDPSLAPSGAVLATGTVSSQNTVAFGGLADRRKFVAYALGQGVRFATPAAGIQDAVPDRQRIDNLEVLSSGGGGGGGAFVLQWSDTTGWPTRPVTSSPLIWQDLTGGASDPTSLMADGDLFIGNAP